MSSKKALKQSQKLAFQKHKKNIRYNKLNFKKKFIVKNNKKK
tara:strand:+ start:485 stop:610 length:126 start_codon:yes stop_codon:yes gene_type:complete